MANDNIVAVHPFHDAGREATGAELMHANPYRPWPARITSITELTPTEKLFEFRFVDERIREAFRQEPGQFVELSIFGVGEAPSPSPRRPQKAASSSCASGARGASPSGCTRCSAARIVGIRGPFGRGFPIVRCAATTCFWWPAASASRLCARSSTTSTTSAASSGRSPSSTVPKTLPRSCSATSSRCGSTAATSSCT